MIEFEWDPGKAVVNRTKQGVTFEEAQTIFGDPFELMIGDPDHSEGEFRFLSVGLSSAGRILVVAYTERQSNKIRIISARTASQAEKSQYEPRH